MNKHIFLYLILCLALLNSCAKSDTSASTPSSPVSLKCPTGLTGVFPTCIYSSGYSGTYPFYVANNSASQSCPSGYTGTYPYCGCQTTYKGNFPNCVSSYSFDSCNFDSNGDITSCVCPQGSSGTYPNCIDNGTGTLSCPANYIQYFAACIPITATN